MAIVPTAKREVTAQAFSGRQSIQTNADMFTGVLGSSATTKTIAKIDQAIDKEERRFLKQQAASDERSLLEIEAELDTFEHDLFNNEQTGIYNQKLGNAQNSTINSQDAFDGKAVALLRRTEQNPRIQNKLQAHLNARRRKIVSNASNWETDQVDKHTEQLLTNKTDRARQSAIDTYDPKNMKQFLQSVKEARDTVRRLGESRGEDDETIEFNQRAAESKIHLGVITRLVKNDKDIEAQTYLDQYENDMNTDDVIALEGMVREAATVTESQQQAKDIWAEANGNIDKARKIARTRLKGGLEDATVARLDRFKKETDEGDTKKAQAFVDKNYDPDNITRTRELIRSNLSGAAERLALADVAVRYAEFKDGTYDKAVAAASVISGTAATQGQDIQAQRQAARNQFKGEMLKATIAELDKREANRLREKAEDQKDAYDTAVRLMDTPNPISGKKPGWAGVTADVRVRLAPRVRESLQRSRVEQDPDVFDKYLKMQREYASGINQVFLTYDFAADRGKTSPDMIAKFQALQSLAKSPDEQKKRVASLTGQSITASNKLLNAVFKQRMATLKNKKKKKQEALKGAVQAQMINFITEWYADPANKNKRLEPTELNRELYGMIVSGNFHDDEFWFGTDNRTDDMEPRITGVGTDGYDTFLPDLTDRDNRDEISGATGVPMNQIDAVVTYLKNNNKALSLKNIEAAYQAGTRRP